VIDVYEPRFYRKKGSNTDNDLTDINIVYRETDILIRSSVSEKEKKALQERCFALVKELREEMDNYFLAHPAILKSLVPVEIPEGAPAGLKEMGGSTKIVGVGPMAAVAGLFAEKVGQLVLEITDEVIVENGGDIFLSLKKDRTVGIYAGKDSPFSGRLAIRVKAEKTPLGICTSAGTVGPSLSLGQADAVVVLSPFTTLADAAATALGNLVQEEDDIDTTLSYAKTIAGISGVLIIKNSRLGMWGDIELI
jgi:uncharacterized protein